MAYFYLVRTFGDVPIIHDNTQELAGIGELSLNGELHSVNGVLPMVIRGDLLWQPMGVVICFGTLLSIGLIVLIMPVSYWLLFKKAKPLMKKES